MRAASRDAVGQEVREEAAVHAGAVTVEARHGARELGQLELAVALDQEGIAARPTKLLQRFGEPVGWGGGDVGRGEWTSCQPFDDKALFAREAIIEVGNEGWLPAMTQWQRSGAHGAGLLQFALPLEAGRRWFTVEREVVWQVGDEPNQRDRLEFIGRLPGWPDRRGGCHRGGPVMKRERLPGSGLNWSSRAESPAVELGLGAFELGVQLALGLAVDGVEHLAVEAAQRRERFAPASEELFVGLGHPRSVPACARQLPVDGFWRLDGGSFHSTRIGPGAIDVVSGGAPCDSEACQTIVDSRRSAPRRSVG